MKRVHPLKKYYNIIDRGTGAEKMKALPEFPRILEFELTNHCNMHCIMCKTGLDIAGRAKGFMEDEIFHKVLDELEGHDCPIKFVGVGESLIHPKAIEYICEAVERGHVCHLTTNGTLLTEEKMRRLVSSGIQSIKISFQGVTPEGYLEMRRADNYETLHKTLMRLHELRGEREYPYISIATSVTDESPEDIENFRRYFDPCCDNIEVGQTTFEWLEPNEIVDTEIRKLLMEKKEKHSMKKVRWEGCPHIFDTLTIHWDGSVHICCSDHCGTNVLGNLRDHSLSYFWMCEKEQTYRKILVNNQYEAIPICSNCYNYMGYTAQGD